MCCVGMQYKVLVIFFFFIYIYKEVPKTLVRKGDGTSIIRQDIPQRRARKKILKAWTPPVV